MRFPIKDFVLKQTNIYENIIECLGQGVISIDACMSITAYNNEAERISGLSRSLTIGKLLEDVFPNDSWFTEILEKTLKQGMIFIEHENIICQRMAGGMGGAVPVGLTTSTVLDHNGIIIGAVALLRDLSSIKPIKEESVRKDRLAFLGTFAAGVAHEVKNPLGGIRGAAQLLSRKVKEKGLSEYTDIIIREVDRLNKILEEILDFANPRRLNTQPINIHEALDTVILLGNRMAEEKTVNIIKGYDPSLPLVLGDKEHLVQVFLNLIKNSVEAITKNGEIIVNTRILTDFHLVEEGYKGGKMVSVEVKDNGSGISNHDMEKLFTPFFTTKAKGSGLGLALSFRIIKEHGGFFKIDSDKGKGTTVSVFLPIA
ncbi:MAG: PAS domain-containing protein [Deltaproteobacteria bacterium]|nr:PAS domain-containing protein [Deltaproteobacteria bacterium]